MLHTEIIGAILEYVLEGEENQREFLAEFANIPSEPKESDVIIPQNCDVFIKLVQKLNQVISQVNTVKKGNLFIGSFLAG
jgi:hypothetical protein